MSGCFGAQRPKMREKNAETALGSFSWPWQRWEFGTPRITCWTCWPQPAQVTFPHFLQVT
ncbi:hypothetical protein GCM10027090_40880 [Sinomonas soli]